MDRLAIQLAALLLTFALFVACDSSGPSGEASLTDMAPTTVEAEPTTADRDVALACSESVPVDGLREGTFEQRTDSLLVVQSFLVVDQPSAVILYPRTGFYEATMELTAELVGAEDRSRSWTLRREQNRSFWTERIEPQATGYAANLKLPTSGCWEFTAHVGEHEATFQAEVHSEPLELEPSSDHAQGNDCRAMTEAAVNAFFASVNQAAPATIVGMFPKDQPWPLTVEFPGLLSDSVSTEQDYVDISDELALKNFLMQIEGIHFTFLHPVVGRSSDSPGAAWTGPLIWQATGGDLLARLGLNSVVGSGKIQFNCESAEFDRFLIDSSRRS